MCYGIRYAAEANMKSFLLAALLFAPALLAAEPPSFPEPRDTPEIKNQLRTEAAALEAKVKASPGNIELYMRLGFTYSRLEQADDAQRAFEGAVNLDPGKADAHYMLGLIYEKKGMRDKALAAWKACLESTSDPRMRNTAGRYIHHLSHH